MPRILSGVQPTGEIHLGNYLGALRHWVARQSDSDCFYFVADLHALTVPHDPAELRERVLATTALLLACGIDPSRSTIFVQSAISAHAELAWVLNCLTTFGELQRMTQFKDKASRQESVSVGLFDYPVLQAADILLYQADLVPVGHDQKQHLELTRDLAERFNARFGGVFKVPDALIAPVGARIMDLQDPAKKMSKSAESPRGTIRLTDSPDELRAKIRTAVTDSGREIKYSADKPALSNLLTIYALVTGTSIDDAEQSFAGKGYAQLKSALADSVIAYLRPIQERYDAALAAPGNLRQVIDAGNERAREIASSTLTTVQERVGLLPAR